MARAAVGIAVRAMDARAVRLEPRGARAEELTRAIDAAVAAEAGR